MGGCQALWDKIPNLPKKIIGHPRLEKQERREGWLQERKEMERKERERKEGEGIFPWSLSLEIDNI